MCECVRSPFHINTLLYVRSCNPVIHFIIWTTFFRYIPVYLNLECVTRVTIFFSSLTSMLHHFMHCFHVRQITDLHHLEMKRIQRWQTSGYPVEKNIRLNGIHWQIWLADWGRKNHAEIFEWKLWIWNMSHNNNVHMIFDESKKKNMYYKHSWYFIKYTKRQNFYYAPCIICEECLKIFHVDLYILHP